MLSFLERSHRADDDAEGVPLLLKVRVTDLRTGQPAASGTAVRITQCDPDGFCYHRPARLDHPASAARRGHPAGTARIDRAFIDSVHSVDSAGLVDIATTVPGCSPGRWPHIHVEVFSYGSLIQGDRHPATSVRIPLPADVCERAYRRPAYVDSRAPFGELTLGGDAQFGDLHRPLLADVTGGVGTGFVARIAVAA